MATAADEFSIPYKFEEIRLAGEGLMAWGTATLSSAGAGYGDEFYVSEIELTGGKKLTPEGIGYLGFPDAMNKALFKAISRVIEDDPLAQAKFSEAMGHTTLRRVYNSTYHVEQGRVA